jgi:hypothetical protein
LQMELKLLTSYLHDYQGMQRSASCRQLENQPLT